MNASDIARLRLHNQLIARPRFEQPSQVVAWLGAVQAQDYSGALWAVGLRLPEAAVADIERAIADKSIIRTWPMRGTLHFVAAADVRWMLELLTPRVVAGSARRNRQLDLDDATFARSKELFGEALRGGVQLSRAAMYQVLERAQIATASQRGLHILQRLAMDGLLCFGAHDGKQPTFALLDEWAPTARRMDRDEALVELARRYFTGHGPATVQDFIGWSGLAAADARAGLEMARSQLVTEVAGGQTYWMSQGVPPHQSPTSEAFLLPGFDEYVVGYRDRSAVLDPAHSQDLVPGNNGMFTSSIVLDSRIAGTWKRTLKREAVSLAQYPFAPLSETQARAVDTAAERYGKFLALPVTRT